MTLAHRVKFGYVALLLLGAAASPSPAADPTIQISAGKYDRDGAIARFDLPVGLPTGEWELQDDKGNVIPLQFDVARHALCVVPSLKATESRIYHLQPVRAEVAGKAPSMVAQREGNAFRFRARGQDVLVYHGDFTPLPEGYDPAFHRGGYIHPFFTPAGKLVTDDYPPNHRHNHGIWTAWTKTKFENRTPDFWNMGEKTGTVEFVNIDEFWQGSLAAGVVARHKYMDLTASTKPKAALNEKWTVNTYRLGSKEVPLNAVDLIIEQEPAGDQPLVLPQYLYGGLGFRGNRQWDGKDGCVFLTSEGKDRASGNQTTGRWCYIGGKVDGSDAGVAILCHPENFRSPQPMRLHPTEPFFCYAPSQAGDWAIEPGKPYVARYRLIAFDGLPDAATINRLWDDFAYPPEVTVQ